MDLPAYTPIAPINETEKKAGNKVVELAGKSMKWTNTHCPPALRPAKNQTPQIPSLFLLLHLRKRRDGNSSPHILHDAWAPRWV